MCYYQPVMSRLLYWRACTNMHIGHVFVLKKSFPTTRSDKPYPTPPKYANEPEANALSLTPDYVYDEMPCTGSRVTAAINNTLVARHASSTTA